LHYLLHSVKKILVARINLVTKIGWDISFMLRSFYLGGSVPILKETAEPRNRPGSNMKNCNNFREKQMPAFNALGKF
jgi:hypothetical protein